MKKMMYSMITTVCVIVLVFSIIGCEDNNNTLSIKYDEASMRVAKGVGFNDLSGIGGVATISPKADLESLAIIIYDSAVEYDNENGDTDTHKSSEHNREKFYEILKIDIDNSPLFYYSPSREPSFLRHFEKEYGRLSFHDTDNLADVMDDDDDNDGVLDYRDDDDDNDGCMDWDEADRNTGGENAEPTGEGRGEGNDPGLRPGDEGFTKDAPDDTSSMDDGK